MTSHYLAPKCSKLRLIKGRIRSCHSRLSACDCLLLFYKRACDEQIVSYGIIHADDLEIIFLRRRHSSLRPYVSLRTISHSTAVFIVDITAGSATDIAVKTALTVHGSADIAAVRWACSVYTDRINIGRNETACTTDMRPVLITLAL